MRLLRLFVVVVCLSTLFSPSLPAATAEGPPKRVVSLNLTADEILVEILPRERLLAVTSFADDPSMSNVAGRAPSEAARLPRADMERLVALGPDLVIVSEYTDADFLKLLETSGLRYHRMRGLDSLASCRQAILDLGRVVGEAEAAERLVARYDATLADLARRLQGAKRPRVLYWSNPFTAGEGTAIGALIEAAGATNVGKELQLKGIVPVGAERAFVAQPDVILLAQSPEALATLRAQPLLSQLPAVREGRVVQLEVRLLITLSHHLADACWRLASLLHPDRVPRNRP